MERRGEARGAAGAEAEGSMLDGRGVVGRDILDDDDDIWQWRANPMAPV